MPSQPDLPLRPMTLGELLDAAAALLRRRALPLLAAAAALAALEQLALAPLREWAAMTPPNYGPATGQVGRWWLVVALGFGMEAAAIVLLSAPAAAAAAAQVLGRPLGHRAMWRGSRPAAAVPLALVVGVLCALGAFGLFLPWIYLFGTLLLAGPALVVDRSRNPLGRSATLASRSGLRACRILAAAYLAWWAVRYALGSSWTSLFELAVRARPGREEWLVPAAWGLANTVAYATLACIAAVLLIETRIRSEGLDIALGRGAGLVHQR